MEDIKFRGDGGFFLLDNIVIMDLLNSEFRNLSLKPKKDGGI